MHNTFFKKKKLKKEIKIDNTSHQYLKSRPVLEETFLFPLALLFLRHRLLEEERVLVCPPALRYSNLFATPIVL